MLSGPSIYWIRSRQASLADEFSKQPAKGQLLFEMSDIFIKEGDSTKYNLVINGFGEMPMSQNKVEDLPYFAMFLLKIRNDDQVKKGIDDIVKFLKAVPEVQRKEVTGLINQNILKPIADRKDQEGLKEQAEYIRGQIKQQ